MKVSEILHEGLTAKWSENRIHGLKPKQLAALEINARNANDYVVLDMIKQVKSDQYQHQEQLANAKREADAEARRDRRAERKITARNASAEDSRVIGRKIEAVVSDCIPDGDPIDRIYPWLKSYFGTDDIDVNAILDKAVKTLGKYKITMSTWLINGMDMLKCISICTLKKKMNIQITLGDNL